MQFRLGYCYFALFRSKQVYYKLRKARVCSINYSMERLEYFMVGRVESSKRTRKF